MIEPVYTFPFHNTHTITCPWGPYVNCGQGLPPGNHNGTDYLVGNASIGGETVVAAASGTVWHHNDFFSCSEEGEICGCGYYVVIAHGNGHRTRYCHLGQRLVSNGATVVRGEVIGKEGNSGTSGIHLHFDVRHGGSNGSDCCSGTSVDPYAGPYSPGTWMWQDNPADYDDHRPAITSDQPTYHEFVRGDDDDLHHRVNGGGWTDRGGCLHPGPGATARGLTGSSMSVFVRWCG